MELVKDILSNVKEEYFIDDKIHGITHNQRVVLLSAFIGIKEKLSDEELKILLQSALYHDIGRKVESNKNHGERSAEVIEQNKNKIFANEKIEVINFIKALCISHSKDDIYMEEISKNENISDVQTFKKIAKILKDADALDRVRLQRFGKLDESYLRTNTAKMLIRTAKELYYESISVLNNETTEQLQTLISDDKYIYLFRALQKGDNDDRNRNIEDIRPNGARYGYDQKYNEELTLEELYEHVRYKSKYSDYTRCISLTEDAYVAKTYNKNFGYIIIRLPKNYKKIIDARKFFIEEIEKAIKFSEETKVNKYITLIDNARSNEELREILKQINPNLFVNIVNRQYFNEQEELEYHKLSAKVKVLENNGLLDSLVSSASNSDVLSAVGNALTSAEYIHYGTISKDQIINCPSIFIEILGMIQQAKIAENNQEKYNDIISKIIELIVRGYDIDENGNLSNGINTIELEKEMTNILQATIKKEKIDKELTINKAFELTKGRISYVETKMQVSAIRSFAETTLKKKILLRMLSQIIKPKQDFDKLFENIYSISDEFLTKQNGRGHQISKTVNILITEKGMDLSSQHTKSIIEKVNSLSIEQLRDIYEKGLDSKELMRIIITTRGKDERLGIYNQKYSEKTADTKYIIEAIIEGYNWKGRQLKYKEKNVLARCLSINANKGDLLRLYEAFSKTIPKSRKKFFSQEEIFGIIINIAIDKKLGNVTYKELLSLSKSEQQRVILDNHESLQTEVTPISIDLMMGRGKKVNKLLEELQNLGIPKEFLESKDIRNIYMAKCIVDGYNWEQNLKRKLTIKERTNLIYKVLDNKELDKCLLTTLVERFKNINLDIQDIYGIIIKSAMSTMKVDGQKIFYKNFIKISSAVEDLRDKKLDTKITENDILLQNLTINEKLDNGEILKSLKKLGIDEKFLEQKDIRNIYTAKQIVDRYNWKESLNRDITDEEKKKIIYQILDISILDKKYTYYLSSLSENLLNIGLEEQEVYGIIIKKAIGEKISDEVTLSYSDMLCNSANINKLKGKEIDCKISRENLLCNSQKEQDELKQELIEIGLKQEFLDKKDIKNVKIAKQIIEEYNWEESIGRKLTNEEKSNIIYCMLDINLFNKKQYMYLSTTVDNLSNMGFNKQESYGIIIKSALDELDISYSKLIRNVKKIEKNINSKITEENLLLSSPQIQQTLQQDLLESGISKEFLDQKRMKNIYTARKIVDSYNWENIIHRKLNDEERKNFIYSVLNNAMLDKSDNALLKNIIDNFINIGIPEQETYGVIIKSSIGENILSQNYSYSTIINTPNKILQLKKDEVNTKISEFGIFSNSSIMQESLKQELTDLGINREFLDTKKMSNIFWAKKIIYEYDWENSIGRKLTTEERKNLITKILENAFLNNEYTSLLSTVIEKLAKIGLKEQDIYGTIIKCAIGEKIVEKDNPNYRTMINSPGKLEILKDKKIDSYVSEEMLLLYSSQIQENLKNDIVNKGIPKEFIDKKDIRNVYMAKMIIDKFNWKQNIQRQITDEEKKNLIYSILNTSILNNDRLLSTLIKNLKGIGLQEQEIYGIIIKRAVGEKIVEGSNPTYTSLIHSLSSIKQLENTKINSVVTENTLEKANKKSEKALKLMKKSLKEKFKNGELSTLETTYTQLQQLIPVQERNISDDILV